MGVFKREGSPNWYIEFVHEGRRIKASSETTDKRKAIAIEAKMRADLLVGDDPRQLPIVTLAEAIDRYIDTVVRPKGNPGVLVTDGYLFGRLRRDLGAATPISKLTGARIATYRDTLLASNLAPATVNRYLSGILAILNRSAHEWGWLRAVPRVKLLRLNNARYRWLTNEEEAHLLKHCPTHLADLVVFLIETGARLTEALSLTWTEVDLDRQPRGLVKFMRTKSGKPRGVPLSSRVATLLADIRRRQENLLIEPEAKGLVFLYAGRGRAGKGVSRSPHHGYLSPHRAWDTAIERAGFADLHLHDLRHTFASRLVMRGVPILAVSKLLGHASLSMTMRYAHLAPDGLDAAVEVMDTPSSRR